MYNLSEVKLKFLGEEKREHRKVFNLEFWKIDHVFLYAVYFLNDISQTPVETYENKLGIVCLFVLRSTFLTPRKVPPPTPKDLK